MSSIDRVIGRQEKVTSRGSLSVVIPAKAGIQLCSGTLGQSSPTAFAGTTILTTTLSRTRRQRRAKLSSNSYFPNSDIFTGRPSWADRSAAKTTRWLSKAVSKLRQWHRFFLADTVDESLELRLIRMVFDIA